MVEYSFCDADSIKAVMDFIGSYWAKGHILSYDHELMDYMHLNVNGGYSFVVARDNGRIVGILGYIPTARYDIGLLGKNDIWLVLWKSIGDIGVGMSMMEFVMRGRGSVSTLGMNPRVGPLYRRFGFEIVDLRQYYLLNASITDYRLAKIVHSPRYAQGLLCKGARLVPLAEQEILSLNINFHCRPSKSLEYLVRRYLKHPVYHYDIYGVELGGKTETVIVIRKVETVFGACLRIVDIVGRYDAEYHLYDEFQRILKESQSEYIDCYNYGCSEAFFVNMGFLPNDFTNIIPNYFEPFAQENIPLKGAIYNPSGDPFVMFKGDCDQDRPNKR